jgi:aryl-alcohol dehydrogenase-like predicted oxidoreductase
METRSLGRTGAQVSVLGLGVMTFGWKTEQSEATAMIDRFLERGGNFIDTANVYGHGKSETMTGIALKEGGKRDKVFLATKVHGKMDDTDPNAWCAAQPGVTSPIIGPNSVAQLEENLAACDVTITDDDRKRVDALVKPGEHVEGQSYYNADFGPDARW